MALKLERTATSYAVDVGFDAFTRIKASEDLWSDTSLPVHEHLDAKLMQIGCTKVEYNGHYGTYIYFTVSYGFDGADMRAKIANLIAAHIKGLST